MRLYGKNAQNHVGRDNNFGLSTFCFEIYRSSYADHKLRGCNVI